MAELSFFSREKKALGVPVVEPAGNALEQQKGKREEGSQQQREYGDSTRSVRSGIMRSLRRES
jgi:hypothetical protein